MTNEMIQEKCRALTDAERAHIAANARGDNVYCGSDAAAEQIARGACDHDAEWGEDARLEAIRTARGAWSARVNDQASANGCYVLWNDPDHLAVCARCRAVQVALAEEEAEAEDGLSIPTNR